MTENVPNKNRKFNMSLNMYIDKSIYMIELLSMYIQTIVT